MTNQSLNIQTPDMQDSRDPTIDVSCPTPAKQSTQENPLLSNEILLNERIYSALQEVEAEEKATSKRYTIQDVLKSSYRTLMA